MPVCIFATLAFEGAHEALDQPKEIAKEMHIGVVGRGPGQYVALLRPCKASFPWRSHDHQNIHWGLASTSRAQPASMHRLLHMEQH